MDPQASLPARKRPGVRLALQLTLLGLSMNAALALADVQRMLIESQSFTIPAGGSTAARAMCLDASQHSPSPATQFTVAPKGDLGDIRVTTADGKRMPLQEAIDKHIVEVRGTQGYAAVEFRNLLAKGDIKVEVVHNSVVVPDGSYQTADLKGLPELHSTHLMSQSALWASRGAQMGVSTAGVHAVSAASSRAYTGMPAAAAHAAPPSFRPQVQQQAQVEPAAAPAPPPPSAEAPPTPPPAVPPQH